MEVTRVPTPSFGDVLPMFLFLEFLFLVCILVIMYQILRFQL